jgi:hypothetical protein
MRRGGGECCGASHREGDRQMNRRRILALLTGSAASLSSRFALAADGNTVSTTAAKPEPPRRGGIAPGSRRVAGPQTLGAQPSGTFHRVFARRVFSHDRRREDRLFSGERSSVQDRFKRARAGRRQTGHRVGQKRRRSRVAVFLVAARNWQFHRTPAVLNVASRGPTPMLLRRAQRDS